MEERKHPLKSRKFWAAILTALVMFINYYTGIELDVESMLAVVLPIVAYIIGEAIVDKEAVKNQNNNSDSL